MKDFGLVSIIMPTYKCGRFILESIHSVQAQTYQNWELIIIDDCSGDNTVDVVKNLKQTDDRISYYPNSSNSGQQFPEIRHYAMRKGVG